MGIFLIIFRLLYIYTAALCLCRQQLRCGCRNPAQSKIPIKCPAPISAENKDVATVKNPSDLPANKKEVRFWPSSEKFINRLVLNTIKNFSVLFLTNLCVLS